MSPPFSVTATDPGSRARRGHLDTGCGRAETLGTRATVTGLGPADLAVVGAQGAAQLA